MKVLYRPHRGGLIESMNEVKEFTCIKDMLFYLSNHSKGAFGMRDIYVSFYSYDTRIGWETYAVSVRRFYDTEHKALAIIGFCTFRGSN